MRPAARSTTSSGARRPRRPRHPDRHRLLDPPDEWHRRLADALDAHRAALDRAATRTRIRRLGALADFLHEHGERGLRALGGRRAATRWLEQQDATLDEPALLRRLEGRL